MRHILERAQVPRCTVFLVFLGAVASLALALSLVVELG